jgi:hypothetical protein
MHGILISSNISPRIKMQKNWENYVNAVSSQFIPATSKDKYETSDSRIGVSGFLDLKPKNPKVQSMYDAMSWNWKGVVASEKASTRGTDFKQNKD